MSLGRAMILRIIEEEVYRELDIIAEQPYAEQDNLSDAELATRNKERLQARGLWTDAHDQGEAKKAAGSLTPDQMKQVLNPTMSDIIQNQEFEDRGKEGTISAGSTETADGVSGARRRAMTNVGRRAVQRATGETAGAIVQKGTETALGDVGSRALGAKIAAGAGHGLGGLGDVYAAASEAGGGSFNPKEWEFKKPETQEDYMTRYGAIGSGIGGAAGGTLSGVGGTVAGPVGAATLGTAGSVAGGELGREVGRDYGEYKYNVQRPKGGLVTLGGSQAPGPRRTIRPTVDDPLNPKKAPPKKAPPTSGAYIPPTSGAESRPGRVLQRESTKKNQESMMLSNTQKRRFMKLANINEAKIQLHEDATFWGLMAAAVTARALFGFISGWLGSEKERSAIKRGEMPPTKLDRDLNKAGEVLRQRVLQDDPLMINFVRDMQKKAEKGFHLRGPSTNELRAIQAHFKDDPNVAQMAHEIVYAANQKELQGLLGQLENYISLSLEETVEEEPEI